MFRIPIVAHILKRWTLLVCFALISCGESPHQPVELVENLHSQESLNDSVLKFDLYNVTENNDKSLKYKEKYGNTAHKFFKNYSGETVLVFYDDKLAGIHFYPDEPEQFLSSSFPRLKVEQSYVEAGVEVWFIKNEGNKRHYIGVMDAELFDRHHKI